LNIWPFQLLYVTLQRVPGILFFCLHVDKEPPKQ